MPCEHRTSMRMWAAPSPAPPPRPKRKHVLVKEISCGIVEGLNTNVKLARIKARGFKSDRVAETALYHELGRLLEPKFTHGLC